jgi:hypothetical protein
MNLTRDPHRHLWLRAMVLWAAGYLAISIASGELAGTAASLEMTIVWRRAAWLISAAAFAAHIAYEHFRLRNRPRTTALHVSAAVALGTFGLAVAANLHAQPTTRQRMLVAASLVLWPAITAIPAFVVALAAAAGLARMTRSPSAR